ncbi:MAG: histidine kinase [Spirosomataceae bacterium]
MRMNLKYQSIINPISMLWAVILLVFFYSQNLFGQILLTDKFKNEAILDCSVQSQVFVDSTKQLLLESVDKQRFVSLKSFLVNQPFISEYKNSYWIKLRIENPTTDTLNVLFTTGIHYETQLYQRSNQGFALVGVASERFLPNQRLFRSDDRYIPIRFLPNERKDFLAKVEDIPKLKFELKPQVVSINYENSLKTKAFYDEYSYILINGFIISILFFVSIFVFGLYLLNRQKFYVYYAAYTFSIFLFFLWEYENSTYFHVFFSYLPFLKFTGNSNIYIFLTHIFYFLFVIEFLEIDKKTPFYAKILKSTAIGFTVFLAVDLIIIFVFRRLDWSFYIYYAFQLLFPILNITLLAIVYRQKGKLALFVKLGSTCLMLGGLAGFLTTLLGFEEHELVLFRISPSYMFDLGVFLEIIFFSTAIGYRTYELYQEQDELSKAIHESELRTLRSQINPHFVFNSLNSIKSYILKHRAVEASEYLTDFSTLMRSILQHSKEQLITLKDELETALLYVKLEQLRFEEGFEFIYECDENIDIEEVVIPPMLLQPYIENAIKHGLMNRAGERVLKLQVSLNKSEKRNQKQEIIQITIEDNGIGREAASLLRKNTPKYQSMGMNINNERVELLNQTNDLAMNIKIIDKKTESGDALGTKVLITILN